MTDYEQKYQEEKKQQLVLWKEMVISIFGVQFNNFEQISNRSEIIRVLNVIGKSKALNHTFMPSGGGLDLSGADYSNEEGLVELKFGGSLEVVNPETLTFHPVGENPEWWYFRLNTNPFAPCGVYDEISLEKEDAIQEVFKSASEKETEWAMSYYGEEVIEIEAGQYVDRSLWELNSLGHNENGNSIPFPKHARIVTRKFNGGDFVIFPTFSIYNNLSATYDGRHNKVNDKEFRTYIDAIVEGLSNKN